ncbi:EF-hand domain-containing protein [Lentzea alba]|uniref:EF-hand domain-containing protein n=1 Tax=Lentzea alba TaxID=2714351 RepID=UPI0039BF6C98
MLSELQRQNIGGIFDVLDTNSDGVITNSDFAVVAARLAAILQHPPTSRHAQSLSEGYLGWWEQIRSHADGDEDGEVSRDEYIAAVDRGLLEDARYLDVIGDVSGRLFAAADKNEDGALGESEMLAIYGAVGLAPAVASGAFLQIDTDGDGRISEAELRGAVRGAFASKGPEEPGSNMLGNA